MNMKTNSLTFKIWTYIALFLTIILIIIWTLQILLLNSYYEWSTKNSMKDIAIYVKEHYSKESKEILYNALAYDNNVCIEVITDNNLEYSSQSMKGCIYLENKNEIKNYKEDFQSQNKNTKTYTILNPRHENKTIIYAVKINDKTSAFINASLEPMDRSIKVLREEFIFVTLIVYLISFIAAMYISKNISRPITSISKSAKEIADGNYDTSVEVGTNIDEIEELAETLNLARIEMAKTDELRRDLMANVSHDLKTPLTMIKAYAEMARDLNQNNEKKREENLNVIIEEADRLNTLVNDLLELSKNENKKETLDIKEYNLTEQIKTIIKRFSFLEEKENYKFIFKENKEIMIKADEGKMAQVIYNLLTNAINYTGKDNKVIIEIKDNRNYYRVNIKDTGKGIDEEEIKFIWNKYYKNEKNHRRNKIGTGLGLSICKSILIMHKFNYGVESKKGKGTTFYFDFKKVNVKSRKTH